MKINFLIFILGACHLLCLTGCGDRKKVYESQSNLIRINPNLSNERTIDFKDFVDTLYTVELDGDADALIGDVHSIKFKDEKVYILDAKISKSVFCFDLTGKLIFKIHNIGQGPGEYRLISSMDLSIDGDTILLFSGDPKKIIKYSSVNGEWLGEMRTPDRSLIVQDMKYLDDKSLMISNDNHSNYDLPNSVYLLKGDSVNSIIIDGLNPSSEFLTASRVFTDRIGNTLYKHPLNDTIYEFVNGQFKPVYIVAFDESSKIDLEDLALPPEELFAKMSSEKLVSMTHSILETNESVSLGVMKGIDVLSGLFYFKESKNIITTSSISMGSNGSILNIPIATFNDFYVSVFNPEVKSKEFFQQLSPNKGLIEADLINLVLVFFKPKKRN